MNCNTRFQPNHLRLNFRIEKEHHLLILQNWFISAQIDFSQICINASLYEWPDHQGPVRADYMYQSFLSLSKNSKSMFEKNIVINEYSISMNSIMWKYYTVVNSLNVSLYKIEEGNAQAPHHWKTGACVVTYDTVRVYDGQLLQVPWTKMGNTMNLTMLDKSLLKKNTECITLISMMIVF